eukprot:gene1829-3541_t
MKDHRIFYATCFSLEKSATFISKNKRSNVKRFQHQNEDNQPDVGIFIMYFLQVLMPIFLSSRKEVLLSTGQCTDETKLAESAASFERKVFLEAINGSEYVKKVLKKLDYIRKQFSITGVGISPAVNPQTVLPVVERSINEQTDNKGQDPKALLDASYHIINRMTRPGVHSPESKNLHFQISSPLPTTPSAEQLQELLIVKQNIKNLTELLKAKANSSSSSSSISTTTTAPRPVPVPVCLPDRGRDLSVINSRLSSYIAELICFMSLTLTPPATGTGTMAVVTLEDDNGNTPAPSVCASSNIANCLSSLVEDVTLLCSLLCAKYVVPAHFLLVSDSPRPVGATFTSTCIDTDFKPDESPSIRSSMETVSDALAVCCGALSKFPPVTSSNGVTVTGHSLSPQDTDTANGSAKTFHVGHLILAVSNLSLQLRDMANLISKSGISSSQKSSDGDGDGDGDGTSTSTSTHPSHKRKRNWESNGAYRSSTSSTGGCSTSMLTSSHSNDVDVSNIRRHLEGIFPELQVTEIVSPSSTLAIVCRMQDDVCLVLTTCCRSGSEVVIGGEEFNESSLSGDSTGTGVPWDDDVVVPFRFLVFPGRGTSAEFPNTVVKSHLQRWNSSPNGVGVQPQQQRYEHISNSLNAHLATTMLTQSDSKNDRRLVVMVLEDAIRLLLSQLSQGGRRCSHVTYSESNSMNILRRNYRSGGFNYC